MANLNITKISELVPACSIIAAYHNDYYSSHHHYTLTIQVQIGLPL